ncbi:hypothetical protein PCH_Pc21g08980 [Penicillium rubens Wisconsin 54-1255]|uniref:Uncharacterized protein n=1 Tax=Penicillium rubens (strain ATCC 28089 / DSM 1075 / NRRL 1951 / Wisconsin 54-1255) TaxID=500485 RepID=B6HMR6_PENRW|nr:hypothetical protein PCH_Pc21g08980 [Penicillium rubens Wisconsin 54-1255]
MRLWSNSIDNLRNEDWAVPLQEMGRMKRAPIFPHNIQGILLEMTIRRPIGVQEVFDIDRISFIPDCRTSLVPSSKDELASQLRYLAWLSLLAPHPIEWHSAIRVQSLDHGLKTVTTSRCGTKNRTVAHGIVAETGSNRVAISFMPFN